MSREAHEAAGRALGAIGVGILTVSDSRTPASDPGGDLASSLARDAGHRVVARALVRDDPPAIQAALRQWIDEQVDLVVTTGGTGLARRDVSPEAVRPLLDRELAGFAAAFAVLSLQAVGPAGLVGRALMGVCRRTLVAVLPGSPDAVRLAMTRLVLPLAPHALHELRR